jgi:hypothetical protein
MNDGLGGFASLRRWAPYSDARDTPQVIIAYVVSALREPVEAKSSSSKAQ